MTKVWLVKELELPDCNFSTVLKVFSSEEAAKTYVESVEDKFWGNLCISEHTIEEMDGLSTQKPKLEPKLKPCRFCKCKQVITWHIGHYDKPWVVECCRCQAQGPHADTEKEAIELWNKGVDE